ncbi:hypothetical protein [Stieleria maiorica]|nr:hypothetical protein [Stieleria maiorica]
MKLPSTDRVDTPPRTPGILLPGSVSLGLLLNSLLLTSLLSLAGCSPPARFENEYGSVFAANDSEAAIPRGMRRTKYGWEDASLWHISTDIRSRSIQSWIDGQRQREPSWMVKIFERIRSTPPLMIAVIQITAIAAIVHISNVYHAEPARSSAKKPSAGLS